MDAYIGKMLDNRYEILELIGTGGMANVYKAKCHRLNRLVAIKILKSDLAQDADSCRRFRDESRAVAQLSHANIMSIYDVARSGDTEYIVMELIDGITLKQYMERRGQMDWREALHFITQIMRGLSHAHSRGIVHRDIKPQNIMVLRDGSVKVADFGIACLNNGSQTATLEALGSVHYISPEQATGDRTDNRSDIYSAGVVLYEMLTGRLPFEGDSAVSIALQHLSAIPLAPREINENIPEALELICMKAMCPNLQNRYATADEMVADLEAFRKDPAVDMSYIRTQLEEPEITDDPTMPLPVKKVNAASERKREAAGKPDPRRIAIISGSILAALLLVFILFKVILGSLQDPETPDSYDVPSVLGYTVEEAMELEGIKDIFRIDVKGQQADDNYLPGQIVRQDPTEGHVRKEGNLFIEVWVCPEEEKILMQNVVGLDYQQVRLYLLNTHLDLVQKVDYVNSDEYEAGEVIDATPALGTELKKGDTVHLTVSQGPESKPVTVISFVGMDEADAVSAAEELKLKVGTVKREYSTEVAAGKVMEQSIAPTTTVDEGTEIILTVSKGPEQATYVWTVTVPETYLGQGSVKVEFLLDDGLVYTTYVDAPTAETKVTCKFSGVAGSSATAKAYFDGTLQISERITFE